MPHFGVFTLHRSILRVDRGRGRGVGFARNAYTSTQPIFRTTVDVYMLNACFCVYTDVVQASTHRATNASSIAGGVRNEYGRMHTYHRRAPSAIYAADSVVAARHARLFACARARRKRRYMRPTQHGRSV